MIDQALSTSRLHPVFRGVFALGYPRLDLRGRALAAVLACGEDAVVTHLTAAALLGLRDRSPAVVDVVSPGQAGRKLDGIRAHFVPLPGPTEVVIRDGIPCTSPARTLVDLAGTLGKQSLRKAVERTAVLGALDLVAIDAAMARPRRGSPVLRRILDGWRSASLGGDLPSAARLRSGLEARLLALIGDSGLPSPRCNQLVEADGKRIEVDMVWVDERLVLEVDGRMYHDDPHAFERDRSRDRALQLNGYRVLRVTASQVAREPEELLSALGRLLGIR
jgi:very-short-patch-repair endonuclease